MYKIKHYDLKIFQLSQIGTCEIILRMRSVFTCQSGHHWIFLCCEIHKHLHPDLLLECLHNVCLVLELLPQLSDGGVGLLLQRTQTSLELSHLPSQQIHLKNKSSSTFSMISFGAYNSMPLAVAFKFSLLD